MRGFEKFGSRVHAAGIRVFLSSMMAALPTFSLKRRFVEILENVQDGLSSYLGWVTAINAALGTAIAVAMWILGMPSPAVWGVAAMMLNYIPIAGALCGISMAFLVALVSFEHVSQAFVAALNYGIRQFAFYQVIQFPMPIGGDSSNTHPSTGRNDPWTSMIRTMS